MNLLILFNQAAQYKDTWSRLDEMYVIVNKHVCDYVVQK
mgnify:FL=1